MQRSLAQHIATIDVNLAKSTANNFVNSAGVKEKQQPAAQTTTQREAAKGQNIAAIQPHNDV